MPRIVSYFSFICICEDDDVKWLSHTRVKISQWWLSDYIDFFFSPFGDQLQV